MNRFLTESENLQRIGEALAKANESLAPLDELRPCPSDDLDEVKRRNRLLTAHVIELEERVKDLERIVDAMRD